MNTNHDGGVKGRAPSSSMMYLQKSIKRKRAIKKQKADINIKRQEKRANWAKISILVFMIFVSMGVLLHEGSICISK